MNSHLSTQEFEEDALIENYVKEYDKTVMPVPDTEFEPFILLNKVRKYYMEHIIKLLSINYERNLKVPSKSIYRLPSAIWRCAKNIEMSAAQMSMVLQIYRKNILSVVEELKNDTNAGKLNKKLHDCLYKPPPNEKRTQTTPTNSKNCDCQCTCNQRKKIRKTMDSQNVDMNPVGFEQKSENLGFPNQQFQYPIMQEVTPEINNKKPNFPSKHSDTILESQSSDDLVQQLQKLFEGDGNDDDIFESVLCDEYQDDNSVMYNNSSQVVEKPDSVVEVHSAQIKSLDERLVSLAGLIINSDRPVIEKPEVPVSKPKKLNTSKWLCEEYFLKMKLLELLDHIRDINRERLKGIKLLFADLFGDDSEEEDLMSPLMETPEFVLSCKERIAPWVVKMLTPYYIKGRIKGKALFKALAKHLIRLIYQCSQYPEEYEVHSFVSDFLKSHKVIRCEADFKEFKIINI